ncbi:Rz1 protein [Erwinia phage PEp14]|uniref:Rz1 protein n=1 Tax=Erwinia phage PEp14 TaxID=1131315 RepID=H2DE62_9CAUD|nr:Rz-like spanin [Erwinia phage PEp14]AEY69621.1 Rz1 protein [Erwinia phage PEp14]
MPARRPRRTHWPPSMRKNHRNWPMPNVKTLICAMLLPLAISGCASSPRTSPQPSLQPVSTPQAEIPAPAAWAMEPHSNSLPLLDSVFSISAPESSGTTPK